MALSDYERRVLHEIELDLGRFGGPPWWRRWRSWSLHVAAAPLVQAFSWSLLVAGCVCAAIYAPPPVAVLCVGLVSFGLGVLSARTAGDTARRARDGWRPRRRG